MRLHDGIAFRELGPAEGRVVLMLHGYPESSWMWRELMPRVAGAGWRALAPDLPGFGDSPPDLPLTWERCIEAVERFRSAAGIERCVLCAHDWGTLYGLPWACEHPDAVEGLVISSGGFFPDGKWHGMAQAMRTPGTGEELVRNLTREDWGELIRGLAPKISEQDLDEYWKAFEGEERRQGHLDFYRSCDFPKFARYDGRLAALGVPALLVWGANDQFAPLAGAHRFARELPDSELVVIDRAGHFVWEDEPERSGEAVTAFLAARL